MNRSNFLGITFEVGSRHQIFTRLQQIVANPGNGSTVVMHGNLNTVYTCTKVSELKSALHQPCALVLFEGIGLKIAKFLTSMVCWPDISGTELFPHFLSGCSDRTLRLALVGGQDGVADAAARAITRQFPNTIIVKTLNGFSDLSDEHSASRNIAQSRPDVVLLGLGTPIQEVKAVAFAQSTGAPLIWCVGGLFDLMAGIKQRAPAWVLACRIEWLWRLMRHPGTYWHRTFIQGPWLLLQILGSWGGLR
jgi:exopolysaccharide biosynthesis WecB/TagA/CpsF family protein